MTPEVPPDAVGFLPETASHRLRLFVTGTTERSLRAIENLRKICEEHLEGRYDLEIIDIYQSPEAVKANQVVAAPTLVKISPDPVRRIVGDLGDRRRVLNALGLPDGAV